MENDISEAIITIILLLIISLMVISAFLPNIRSSIRNSKIKKRLETEGRTMYATIIEIRDTGTTINNNPYVKLTVETVDNYKATFSTLVSRLTIPRVGDKIEVLYDPQDPTVAVRA